ncbi:MAG: hypothetical protein BGO90_13825 [Legionella sp. 40-6]|nr:DUF1840 domain-containing protein [Legionella sp.]OJY18184.1 MAG: hypothetical protein BGO90_13825 [Legionella sp. 40-6]
MLVTFYSKAYEDITYFGEIAKTLIHMMGHSGAIPGAIKAQDLPAALDSLRHELQNSKAADAEDDNAVGLAKRAVPLINLIQAAIKKDCDILWDV